MLRNLLTLDLAQLADAIPQLASVTLNPCVAALNSVAVLGAIIVTIATWVLEAVFPDKD